MKVYNAQENSVLNPGLASVLAYYRRERNFNSALYVKAKTVVLNDYFKRSGLKSAVVAVSGGVDSAVVLALVHAAAQEKDSPIKKIVPVLMPVFKSDGATNQEEATQRGKEVCARFKLEPIVINLTNPHKEFKTLIDQTLHITGEGWASGQLIPYLRTPTLYYLTSLLAQQEMPGVICGTTNKDEGAYLGYFGKASDGMVDLQLISDIHKSEVFSVGHFVGCPDSILGAVPTGDMYDGRVDEAVFGFPYDFCELYLHFLVCSPQKKEQLLASLSKEDLAQFKELANRVEKLHGYNKHNYIGCSPAVHLDVLDAKVPNGWKTNTTINEANSPSNLNRIVGGFELAQESKAAFTSVPEVKTQALPLKAGLGLKVSSLLTPQECRALLKNLKDVSWTPVGLDGIKQNYKEGTEIGSFRASCFAPEISALLWERLKPNFNSLRVMNPDTPTDWDGNRVWEPVGVSSLLRFIRYKKDGKLIPHYDAPYVFNSNKRTLMSVVISLTSSHSKKGGATRFIKDPQDGLKLEDKDYSDWTKEATKDKVDFQVYYDSGEAIVFDHRILHDSEPLKEEEKIILRTDVVFEKRGL